jgi:hypothetical protein
MFNRLETESAFMVTQLNTVAAALASQVRALKIVSFADWIDSSLLIPESRQPAEFPLVWLVCSREMITSLFL